ncbi:hypothetical protein SLS58_004817 [Diplodia intermedia]|uniref:Uncharacterized protein n=1 Tax=Diplodia intermedia TaxID=856260 RepID=A0ABR3TSX2_9PEZI
MSEATEGPPALPPGLPQGSVQGPSPLNEDMQPMKTFGPKAHSGLWALAGAIANSQSFGQADDSVKYQQYLIYCTFSDMYFDPDWTELVQRLAATDDRKCSLLNRSFMTHDHLRTLLNVYAAKYGSTYNLALHYQLDNDANSCWTWTSSSDDSDPTLQLLNRDNNHWECMVYKCNASDISESGLPLSQGDSTLADDPRVSGIPPPSAASTSLDENWSDAVTGKNVTHKTKLVRIKMPKPKSAEWAAVRSCWHHNCQIVLHSDGKEVLLPALEPGTTKNDRSLNLTISFGSMAIAPYIELRATTFRPHDKFTSVNIHSGYMRFAFGKLVRADTEADSETTSYSKGITDFEVRNEQYDDALYVTFQYDNAIPSNLKPNASTEEKMVEKELDVLRHLQEVATPSKRSTITFRILLKKDESAQKTGGGTIDFLDFLSKIKSLKSVSLPPYSPFLSRQGLVNAQPHSMKSICQRLKDGDPHMPIKAYPAFMDAVEAGVQIAFDVDTEWSEQVEMLTQFEHTWHWVRFANYGKNVVALLRLRERKNLFDSKSLLKPGTEVILKWSSPRRQNEQSALFFVVDDILFFSNTDIVLVAKNKNVGYFGRDACTPHNVAQAAFLKTSVKVKIVDITYRHRIDATDLVWNTRNGRKDLWPLLLNNNPQSLPDVNVFETLKVDKDIADAAIQEVVGYPSRPPNEEQKMVVEGMRAMKGGIQIVQAPGGTGKTTTECHVGHVYFKIGACILLTAPTDAAVDVVCKEYVKTYPNDPRPLRIPASNRDLEDQALGRAASFNDDQEERVASEDVVIMELLSHAKSSHKNQRSYTDNVLTVSIDAALGDKFELMCSYMEGNDPITNQPIFEPGTHDMVQELKKFYLRSTDPTQPPHSEWEDDDKRHYRQALQYVEEEIVRQSPIVACTTSSCGQKLVRQNAGVNFNGIAVAIDEGSRDREADTYIPLTKLSSHPVALHIFGDMKQGLPVHISSLGKGFNEFINRGKLPLMNRLISQGYPFIALKKQYRMHRILMAFPNQRFYDSTLITDDEANKALNPELAKCLQEISGFEGEIPDDILRLLYFEVSDSTVRKSSNTHSRANLEHVEFVMTIIKKLQATLGGRTRKTVMIQTPYRRQASAYRDYIIDAYRKERSAGGGVDQNLLPDVRTVDSAQGSEADIVILDLVNVSADKQGDIGHMSDENRACVALTRAKQVLWVVGGAFRGKLSDVRLRDDEKEKANPLMPLPSKKLLAILELKRDMTWESRCLKIEKPVLTRPIPSDLDPSYEHSEINEDGTRDLKEASNDAGNGEL